MSEVECAHPHGRVYVNAFNRSVTCADCDRVRYDDGTWYEIDPHVPSPLRPASIETRNEILAAIGYPPYEES